MAAVLQLVSFVADLGMSPEAAAQQRASMCPTRTKVTADRGLRRISCVR